MASLIECAHLAWAVGIGPLSGGSHRTPLLPGWKALQAPPLAAQAEQALHGGGFGARAYLNPSTGDMVVAYRGRDLPSALPGPARQDLPELLLGLSLVLGRRGVEIGTELRRQAITHCLAVVASAQRQGQDPGRLFFTGHGMGAALAASMAVWLGRPATLFAAAPFTVAGGGQDCHDALSHVSVQGEPMGYARHAMPFAVSAERDRAIEAGPAPVSKALALHRMDLHLALLLDERLPALMQRLPELLPALCGGSPDPAHDLIGPLIEDQLRQGTGAPSALRRFIDDVEKLPLLGAFDTLPGGRQALIALLAILHGSLAGRGARPSPWPADEAPPGPASGTQHQHRPGIGVREPA